MPTRLRNARRASWKLIFLKFVILLCMGSSFGAAPVSATSRSFEPCEDANTHAKLAGSICLVSKVQIRPVEHTAESKGDISLFIRKFPTDPRRRRGEVWLIAGGPGEAGASFYPVLDVLRQAFPDHDLVIPDHRGTGYSSKLCPVEEAQSSPDGIALAGSEWGSCIQTLHADAARTREFTVTNAAHDLSTLISRHRARGEVYLYGASYGTQLILRMMLIAPATVDGIVLDGLVPLETDARWDLSRRTQVVDMIGRSLLTADQIGLFRTLLIRENRPWRTLVPGGDLRAFMGRLLSFPDLRARIPAILTDLARDDTGSLERSVADLGNRLGNLTGYRQSPPSFPLAMLIGGSENNLRRGLTADMVEREAEQALFTSAIPGLLTGTPAPLYERDRYFGVSPTGLPRTLIVHGTMDPNTPFEGAMDHASVLSSAGGEIHFTAVVGAAHFLPLVAPTCFRRAVHGFVAGQSVPERCTSQIDQ